jgi:hypothetical protein
LAKGWNFFFCLVMADERYIEIESFQLTLFHRPGLASTAFELRYQYSLLINTADELRDAEA